jgi:DNA-binding transcriptional ArsR family regulator
MSRWGLLSNHALVLIHVVEHPRSTFREIADAVGVTDRAANSLLRAIEEDGIITRRKQGRQNVYSVDLGKLMEHRSYGRFSIGQIAAALLALAGRDADAELPPGIEAMAAALSRANAASAGVSRDR